MIWISVSVRWQNIIPPFAPWHLSLQYQEETIKTTVL